MQQDPAVGSDFWTTVKAVSPVVGGLVGAATIYLRLAIRDENNKQRKEMMEEIRELFALKETIEIRFQEVNRRVDRLEAK